MKTVRLFVCLATMTIATGWANAADYSLHINNKATVGGKELNAGDYRLEIAGDKAMIHGKKDTVEASVKVEEGAQKYGGTTVQYSMSPAGKYRIDEIHLGGTRTKLVFND
jgi:hypothetical protein